jgi:hypothetical protein
MKNQALISAIAVDSGFIAAEILLETGLFATSAGAIAAIIVLLGHFALYLALGYSVRFNIGEAQQGLLAQLGIRRINPIASLIVGLGAFFAFFWNFIVALALPIMCIHGVLISLVGPKGIDALEPTSPIKAGAVALGFASIVLSLVYDKVFRNRASRKREQQVYGWGLPILCVAVGASLAPLEAHITAAGTSPPEESSITMLFYYLPIRYLVARVSGITWPGVILSAAVIYTSIYWL